VEEAVTASDRVGGGVAFRLDQMERGDRQLLHERHLVSKELGGVGPRSPAPPRRRAPRPRPIGVMVNEEDHLRLNGLRSGFALEEA